MLHELMQQVSGINGLLYQTSAALLLNTVLPPPEPRDTGGNLPWGKSYEAVQDLSEAVRRAVDALGG